MFRHVVAEAVEVRSPKQGTSALLYCCGNDQSWLFFPEGNDDDMCPLDSLNCICGGCCPLYPSSSAARQIDHAIVTALTLKKPVYIEIACNIAEEAVSVPIPFQLPPPKPSNKQSQELAIKAVKGLWDAAAKPVLVIGVKVRMAKAHEAVVRLADALGCVVAVMPDAKGMFPEDHPNFVGESFIDHSSFYYCSCPSYQIYLLLLSCFFGVISQVLTGAMCPPRPAVRSSSPLISTCTLALVSMTTTPLATPASSRLVIWSFQPLSIPRVIKYPSLTRWTCRCYDNRKRGW